VSGGRWFVDNVSKKIGNDNKMLFLHEPWLGWEMVDERFSRMINLTMEKFCEGYGVRKRCRGRLLELEEKFVCV